MEMNYDENTLHQLEQELNVQILPGTEVMIDVGAHHFVKSSATSDRVLVPQPSEDPHDPLNWNTFWKVSTMTCATAVSFTMGFGPLALAPMFPQLIEAFDSNLTDVVQFTGVCILVLGFSNFIWVPISTSFGRRPVYIASTMICLISNIWRAKAQTYGSFMGACVLNGIGAGPGETIQPTVIADVMFLHDRGKYNTLYFAFYFGSLMVGPIVSGPMADHSGWRNFWWLNVALLGVTLIMLIFGFPETKWHRIHPEEMPDLSHAATAQRDPFLGLGTPSKQQFRLFQPNGHPFRSIAMDLWTPWKLFAFPIVEFASFVVSWSASSFLTINLTQSQAFAAPPYNFSSEKIGFFNFAILVGAMVGLFSAGPLSDWVCMRATRKNKGIREPEMRLPSMIPYVLIMMLGNFIVAFGYQNAWNWKVIVIIGFTCAGIQVAALPSIASTYAVDSYKPVSGSIFVSITVNKNVWGYGFSKFITPWIISSGYVPPIMTNMGLVTLWCLFGVLCWWKGKRFRFWSRDSKVHRM
ncbi:MAG: hypothetical protein M1830_003158 [Pleopsidium flavum]|nr:MAG: hypothetical protein M1830_003158 [Pleopsidium flavum]